MEKSYFKFVFIFQICISPCLVNANPKLFIQVWNQTPYDITVSINNSIDGLDSSQKSKFKQAFNNPLPANPNLISKRFLSNHDGSFYDCRIDFTLNVRVDNNSSDHASDRFRFDACYTTDPKTIFTASIVKYYSKNGIQFSVPLYNTSANVYQIFVQKIANSPPPKPANPFVSLGLGNITFDDGLGKDISYSEVNTSKGSYTVHFSRSDSTCSINNGIIQCNDTIAYKSVSNHIVFMCDHINKSSGICPWVMKKGAKSAQNFHVSYM